MPGNQQPTLNANRHDEADVIARETSDLLHKQAIAGMSVSCASSTLLALIVPETSKIGTLPQDAQRLSKGFQPVNAPARFIDALKEDIRKEAANAQDRGQMSGWAFTQSPYEILK